MCVCVCMCTSVSVCLCVLVWCLNVYVYDPVATCNKLLSKIYRYVHIFKHDTHIHTHTNTVSHAHTHPCSRAHTHTSMQSQAGAHALSANLVVICKTPSYSVSCSSRVGMCLAYMSRVLLICHVSCLYVMYLAYMSEDVCICHMNCSHIILSICHMNCSHMSHESFTYVT